MTDFAIFAGLFATQKDDYPITVQTGHSVSEIIVSPERIDYTGIDSPDFFVVLSEDGLARARSRIEALAATCALYAEETLELPATRARVRRLPFAELSRRVGRPAVATAALAALLEDVPRSEFFNLETDPGELENLIESEDADHYRDLLVARINAIELAVAAESAAGAETTIVYSRAPFSSRTPSVRATLEFFWPTAT